MDILQTITQEFNLNSTHVKNIVSLIDEGNTIPFIARYRKEMTGSCDDQILRELFDRLTYLRNLEKRKEEVANSITEQGKMTDEISEAIDNAMILAEVEDIYRPYKQKKGGQKAAQHSYHIIIGTALSILILHEICPFFLCNIPSCKIGVLGLL